MLTNKQKEKIYNLISQKQEGAYWDFKREWYSKEKQADLLHDIICMVVLCQDLVQVKMRNYPHFNLPEARPPCAFFHTLVRIRLVTYSYNDYEFVSYCRKLPDIRKSTGMPACNRGF